MGETGDGLSEHLASRRDVEKGLASGGVPVTVLRAAMIIGSGCQTALFEPRGLFGLAYWYAVLPFHGVVFRTMLAGARRDAL